MKVFVHSLNSCGMRNTDVKRYRDFLTANGHELTNSPEDSDVVLLWTCAFRGDMRDNSLAQIKQYKKNYKAELVVAGCLPDIDKKMLNERFKGHIINWRNDEKKMEDFFGAPNKKISEIPRVLFKGKLYDDELTFRRKNRDADVPYIGRYIQIYVSEGCPFECTCCSERLTFPPYRSFSEDEIVETCRRQVEHCEKKAIVLLADSVGSYGSDTCSSLPTLINKIKDIHPDLRIAMQGFNPFYFLKFYDEIVEFLRSGLIVHLQIPYQSASDRILKLMKRPYNRADIEKVFSSINEIGFTEFDTHIIAGFPGETEEEFEETVQFALRHRPKYVLLNGFMETPDMATKLLAGKVSPETIHSRLKEAEIRLKDVGILCNCDNSVLSKERFKRMNKYEQIR
ncbi:radical SAM protein [Patescibacteria group bacterium]|nr:radical SAM protein [Patescibacteria group bacterium]MBU0846457.1 radical SAM protein [Patescibacteria group bacterium]